MKKTKLFQKLEKKSFAVVLKEEEEADGDVLGACISLSKKKKKGLDIIHRFAKKANDLFQTPPNRN